MLTISIQRELFTRFPDLIVGGFVVTELDTAAVRLSDKALATAWEVARDAIAMGNVSLENIANMSVIHDWRSAFAACGAKPSTFKSSVEALVRRTLKDGAVQTPLPVVTLYCAVSARHMAPLGGYDLDALPEPAMTLRAAQPETDSFEPLGGRAADMPLGDRIVVYGSGDQVTCYLFNHRDSKRTCLQPATRRALFLGEAVTPGQRHALERALDSMREHLSANGAQVGAARYVSSTGPSTSLEFAHLDAIDEVLQA